MYRASPALALAGVLAVVVAGCSAAPRPAPARHKPPVSYYLALGDSLAVGVQPDAAGTSVETRSGYADQLYATLRRSHPGLRLVKLGCPGETTVTMMKGGICPYPGGSQLAAAISFLHAHRAHRTRRRQQAGDRTVGAAAAYEVAGSNARHRPEPVAG